MQAALRKTETSPLSNADVAQRLDEIAEILDAQHANRYRVHAYRTAASTVRALPESVSDILAREGLDGLQKLPGICRTLSHAIEELSQTGRSALLEQIRGTVRPERILTTVACIGSKTAARIHDQLGIETLAELEAAAYDGRLAAISGMGTKKVRAVRESLAGRFQPRPRIPASKTEPSADVPSVAVLLEIDEDYRRKAAVDRLPRISPRRFNPSGEAWLPILHTQRGTGHYTALFSNTARAHELGTDHDWVVISRNAPSGDGQWTVITALFGPLKGRRIIRGRERECAAHYEKEGRAASLFQ